MGGSTRGRLFRVGARGLAPIDGARSDDRAIGIRSGYPVRGRGIGSWSGYPFVSRACPELAEGNHTANLDLPRPPLPCRGARLCAPDQPPQSDASAFPSSITRPTRPAHHRDRRRGSPRQARGRLGSPRTDDSSLPAHAEPVEAGRCHAHYRGPATRPSTNTRASPDARSPRRRRADREARRHRARRAPAPRPPAPHRWTAHRVQRRIEARA